MDIVLIESLLAVLIAAGIGRILSYRIGQPLILGELLMGMVLGNLGIIELNETIMDIADIGIMLLLFYAGLGINLDELKRLGKSSAVIGFAGIISSFTLGYVLTVSFGFSGIVALFIGLCIITTSIGVPVAVLKEKNMLGTRFGALIIGSSVVDDVVGIFALGIFVSMISTGIILFHEILLKIVLVVLFFTLSLTLGVKAIRRASRRFMPRHENILFTALVIILIFGLFAKSIGLEDILGVFLAGLLLGQSHFSKNIDEQVSIFGDVFFIPIFFVATGMLFHPHELFSVSLFAVALIAVEMISKVGGCWIGSRIAGLNSIDSLFIGVSMIPQAGVELIMMKLALDYGVIGQDIASAVLMMVIVTMLVTPFLMTAVLKRIKHK